MPTGTIKFFSAPKGFGFITPDDGGKDIFLPLLTLTAMGLTTLSLGQRVSFEVQPDKKGPKAISLALVASAPPPPRAVKMPPVPEAVRAPTSRLTFYYDPGHEDTATALAALRATGVEHSLVDYMASPPGRDRLIGISLLLRESDQSLMRKYDPLFRELRLDDRFISQNELWDAIVENPCLINGPILANGTRARICRSAEDIAAFLENRTPRKGAGRAVSMPAPQDRAMQPVEIPAAPAAAPVASARKPKPVAKAASAKKVVEAARPKPRAKPVKKVAAKAKAKSASKAKPVAEKKKK